MGGSLLMSWVQEMQNVVHREMSPSLLRDGRDDLHGCGDRLVSARRQKLEQLKQAHIVPAKTYVRSLRSRALTLRCAPLRPRNSYRSARIKTSKSRLVQTADRQISAPYKVYRCS